MYNAGPIAVFSNGAVCKLDIGSLTASCIILIAIIAFLGSVVAKVHIGLEELILYLILGLVAPALVATQNLLSFFVGLETISFSFFILTGLRGATFSFAKGKRNAPNNRPAEAALRYLIPALFSSLILLVGIGFIYINIPTLDLEEIKLTLYYQILFNPTTNWGVRLGLILIVISFLFKFTAVPFHRWVFGVYSGVPLYVVFLISTIAKLIYFLGFVKIIWPICSLLSIHYLVALVGFFSIFIGTIHGIYEYRFSVVLACSGVLNMGYALLALSLGTVVGTAIAIFSLIVYVSLVLGLGMLLHQPRFRIVALNTNVERIDNFTEWANGGFSIIAGLTIVSFALIGVPPLIGFFPKFFLFTNLLINFPAIVSWGFLVSVIISAFIYFQWILQLATSKLPYVSLTLTWAANNLGLIAGSSILVAGWEPLVDWSLVGSVLCGGG